MPTYTHGYHDSVLRSHRWRTAANSASYLLAHLTPEIDLLDVGAGPGTITADLAGMVRSVTATELSAPVLELARREAESRGVTNITFEIQDVHDLGFADHSFDVVHAHQVLQHVADPVRALAQMRRVARPGGIVAARDSDYAAFAWYPLIPELDRWLSLYRGAARANGGEPDAGRRLASWARRAGFDRVESSSSTWCFSTPEDRRWWGDLWAERMTRSAVARQLIDTGAASDTELAKIADAWRAWADSPDGWFSVLHGEILCRA